MLCFLQASLSPSAFRESHTLRCPFRRQSCVRGIQSVGSRRVFVSDAAPASRGRLSCVFIWKHLPRRGADWDALWPRRRRLCWPRCARHSPGLAAMPPRPCMSVPGLLGSAGDTVAVRGATAPSLSSPSPPVKWYSVGANGHVRSY